MRLKSITKRYQWYTKVKFDRKTGFYYQTICGRRMFIRHPRHFVAEKDYNWMSEEILFQHYLPLAGDLIVDFGLGYGAEALYAASRFPELRYVGIEPQPMIYELVCNTLAPLGDCFSVCPYVITAEPIVKFSSQFGYGAVGTDEQGCVQVPTMAWNEFIDTYKIGKIDLIKINIEGAERQLLEHIDDFSNIKRIIVSCHDFRAEHGHGEYFRTKAHVIDRLKSQGFDLKFFELGITINGKNFSAQKKPKKGLLPVEFMKSDKGTSYHVGHKIIETGIYNGRIIGTDTLVFPCHICTS